MVRSRIFFLLILMFLISCGSRMQETVAETYPDGKPKRVQYFTGEGENKYLAKDVFYYPDGRIKLEGEYGKDGKKNGKWTYWYQNGNKWSEGYFSEGLDDGLRKTWHENGQIHYKGHYDKGKRVGTWTFYDENGKKTKEIDYDKEKE